MKIGLLIISIIWQTAALVALVADNHTVFAGELITAAIFWLTSAVIHLADTIKEKE